MNIYDALYLASTPALFPYFWFKYAFRGKYHESLPGMLGRRLPEPTPPDADAPGGPRVWIHAVSVGEVVAARSIMAPLREAVPDARFLVSTITETGQAMARKTVADEVEDVFYYPIDLSWNVRRFLDTYRPDVFILMETELWPNMLTLAGERGVKVFLLNGRLSDRSYPRYRRFRRVFRDPLESLKACAVQTPTDAERLRELCGPGTRIEVTGNCKFDAPVARLDDAARADLREKLGLSDDRAIVVAGSTHPGEEDLVLNAWRDILRKYPRATLIIAPRHPERFDEAARVVARHNLTLARASQGGRRDPQVLLLDQMGVLARVYGLGDVAVVCGSFAPIGGHNLLEAAAHEVPVVYGPHMHKQRELLRIVNGSHGGIQVEPERLGPTLVELLGDPDARRRHGRAAREAFERNQGSARRSVNLILPFIRG